MRHDLACIFVQVKSSLMQRPRISLQRLSRQLGVERHTLEKAVRNMKGSSFREFQREVILIHITEALRADPGMPFKELAATLGYSSVQAFTRFVSKACGTSPSSLRRQAPAPPAPEPATSVKTNFHFC